MCLKLLMPTSLALLTLIFGQGPLMASVYSRADFFHSYSNSALQWQMIQMQLKNHSAKGQLIQYLPSSQGLSLR